jgi:hypothetical protein
MNEEQTNKPNAGTWGRLGKNEESSKLPKITFEINLPQQVTFLQDEPKEIPSRDDPDSVFYVFSVSQAGIEKEIATSAWTLLGALKQLAPLKDKEVVITKKLVKGKQSFDVALVK